MESMMLPRVAWYASQRLVFGNLQDQVWSVVALGESGAKDSGETSAHTEYSM
jgi:hypothetical protein